MQKLTRICSSESLHFLHSYFSVCCILLAQLLTMHQFAFQIRYTIQSSTRCPRERVAVNMLGSRFTLARLKIVHSYLKELVSYQMPEHIEEAFS